MMFTYSCGIHAGQRLKVIENPQEPHERHAELIGKFVVAACPRYMIERWPLVLVVCSEVSPSIQLELLFDSLAPESYEGTSPSKATTFALADRVPRQELGETPNPSVLEYAECKATAFIKTQEKEKQIATRVGASPRSETQKAFTYLCGIRIGQRLKVIENPLEPNTRDHDMLIGKIVEAVAPLYQENWGTAVVKFVSAAYAVTTELSWDSLAREDYPGTDPCRATDFTLANHPSREELAELVADPFVTRWEDVR